MTKYKSILLLKKYIWIYTVNLINDKDLQVLVHLFYTSFLVIICSLN